MHVSSITPTSITNSNNHYEIIFGDNFLKVVANVESHSLAMEAVQTIKAELGSTYRFSPQPIPSEISSNEAPVLKTGEVLQQTPTASPTPPPAPSPSKPEPVREKLSFYAEAHLRNMKCGKGVTKTSLNEVNWTLNVLQDLIGNKPLDHITYSDVTKFQDAIEKWPANIQRRKDFEGLRPREIIMEGQRQKLKPITRDTKGKHINTLCTFFNWCVESKHLMESPANLIDCSRYKDPTAEQTKIWFDAVDLQALLDPTRTKCFRDPRHFWLMEIALRTSMRIREICQLSVDDIKRDSGLDELGNPIDVVYFNVAEDNDEEGKKKKKSVKTPYSVRKVPIPDYLLNLGFLQYVEDVAKAGFSEVFPRVENKEEDPGHPMTMWFRKYRNACGIKSRKKTFHCFRHTFTSLAKYSLIPENVIDAINGHAPENTCKDRRYATRPNVFACKKYIEKIAFPPTPMQPYTSGRFDAYFETVKESRQHQTAHQESLERREKEEVKKAKASKK